MFYNQSLVMQAHKRHNELNFMDEPMVFNATQPLFLQELQNPYTDAEREK